MPLYVSLVPILGSFTDPLVNFFGLSFFIFKWDINNEKDATLDQVREFM